MQFIQDLPFVVKVADAAMLVLVLALVVIVRRRRSSAAAPAERSAPKPSRKARRAENKGIPRRKRRKLAAEAAQAMGVEEPPEPAAAEPIVVPPVEIAPEPAVEQEPVPVAAADPMPVVAEVGADDPYVSEAAPDPVGLAIEAPVDDDADVVGHPGWPSPGELASSFDPDVFDPLPEIDEDALADEVEESQAEHADQPTGVIEMPALDEVVDAVEEMEEWTGDFDPATGWADDPADATASSAWEHSHADGEPDALELADEEPPAPEEDVDAGLDRFWGDPDDDWAEEPAPPVGAEFEAVAVGFADEDDDSGAIYASEAEPVDQELGFDAGDWAGEEPVEWPVGEAATEDLAVPFPAPGTISTHAAAPVQPPWTPTGAQPGPVVLDLAGIAALGKALELVIEPSPDGTGVRLRIAGADGPAPDADPQREAPVTADPPDEDPVDADDATLMDVPFLTGGMPDAPVQAVEPAAPDEAPPAGELEEAATVAEQEPAMVPLVRAEPDEAMAADAVPAVEPLAGAEPDGAMTAETSPAMEPPSMDEASPVVTAEAWETPAHASGESPADPVEVPAVPLGEAPAPDPGDAFTEDPAKILADIRARLAALDARRA